MSGLQSELDKIEQTLQALDLLAEDMEANERKEAVA